MESGETMRECAARELFEEAGIRVAADAITPRGKLKFTMLADGMVDKATGHVSSILHVYLFSALCSQTDVTPTESDEMLPKWWLMDEVPLEKMWPDDRYWLPKILGGEDVEGEFVLSDKNTILEHEVRTVGQCGSYVIDL